MAAFLYVCTGSAFCDHAFQVKLLDLFEELLPLTHDVFRDLNEVCRLQGSFQDLFALNQRTRHQVITVDVKEIKDEVDDMSRTSQSFEATLAPDPRLQELEAWHAVLIQRDNLSIKDDFFRVDLSGDLSQFRILRRHVDLVARNKARLPVLHKTDRPKAVPLRLKDPLRIRKRVVDQRRQHRMNNL